MSNDKYSTIYPIVGTKLTCPKCKKVFTVTDDTRYLYGNEYVCTWKCFLTPIDKIIPTEEHPEEVVAIPSIEQPPPKPKRTRRTKEETPSKNVPLLDNGVVDLFG